MSYIKPLGGSIGPKSTKCEIRDETVHCDYDDFVSTVTTTRTPDVPSGGVFSVKTRTCITWASSASSRVVVTTQVEWTGRSFIRGASDQASSCRNAANLTFARSVNRDYRKVCHRGSEIVPPGFRPCHEGLHPRASNRVHPGRTRSGNCGRGSAAAKRTHGTGDWGIPRSAGAKPGRAGEGARARAEPAFVTMGV